jgi:hypothetical protein
MVMAQDTQKDREAAEPSSGRKISDPLEALVRCLARGAAEKDYLVFRGPAPTANPEDRE